MSKKTALVTGGLGFVGSNLVDKLIEDGYIVTVLDNLSSESSTMENENYESRIVLCDVNTINDTFLINERFDFIFHLAANARIQPSFENPVETWKNNADGTFAICEFARKTNSGPIIYAGTSSKIQKGPYISPYTFSKVTGEEILEMYNYCYEVPSRICTFFNVYGPREPSKGEYSTVVRKFQRQYENDEELTVVGDGKQARDFTHVSDICEGLICAAIYESNEVERFELGRGQDIQILDLAKMYTDKIKFVPLRKYESYFSLSKWEDTQKRLGWRAKINLKDYIKEIKNG